MKRFQFVNGQWIKSLKAVKYPIIDFSPPSLCETRSLSPESSRNGSKTSAAGDGDSTEQATQEAEATAGTPDVSAETNHVGANGAESSSEARAAAQDAPEADVAADFVVVSKATEKADEKETRGSEGEPAASASTHDGAATAEDKNGDSSEGAGKRRGLLLV